MLVAKKEEIKKRRLKLNLSQRQLSQKAGLPNNAVANAMGCSIFDIFEKKKLIADSVFSHR